MKLPTRSLRLEKKGHLCLRRQPYKFPVPPSSKDTAFVLGASKSTWLLYVALLGAEDSKVNVDEAPEAQ